MSEWNSIISVLGTLGGTIIGLVLGYWTSSKIESRRQKHEIEMKYQKEIMSRMDDIVRPLYNKIQEAWSTLAVLRESVIRKSSIIEGGSMQSLQFEAQQAYLDLKKFVDTNDTELNLLLPHSISTWVFAPIEEKIGKIFREVPKGEQSLDEFTTVINALMLYQKNLKKLIGFETGVELEEIYPFK
ncbi:MAG: hypothetical protein JW702_08935 [Clostridiales bacterium]|nr:hypothetical protein [Clostridiales bacterium]